MSKKACLGLTPGQREPIAPEFEPPPGGRIHILHVKVILDRDWQEAVNAAAPNTPDTNYVYKVSVSCRPTEVGVVEKEVILLNGGSWDRAIAWAKQYALKQTVPRVVFAIGEHYPQLHRKLRMKSMYVIATEVFHFWSMWHSVGVWWRDTKREACLDLPDSGSGASRCWFAFSRE